MTPCWRCLRCSITFLRDLRYKADDDLRRLLWRPIRRDLRLSAFLYPCNARPPRTLSEMHLKDFSPARADKYITVSWNWGAGAAGGEVTEKKTEGEVTVTSKRGGKAKKNAEPNNPAVATKRSGNDVVKKASELNIEEKADSKKRKAEEEGEKADEGAKEDAGLEKSEEGKDVKKGGKKATAANKKQKKSPEKEEKKEEKEEKKVEKKEDKKEEKANGEKKGRGRPKKEDTAEGKDTKASASKEKKTKKEPAPPKEGDMVSTRTRSRGKA